MRGRCGSSGSSDRVDDAVCAEVDVDGEVVEKEGGARCGCAA